MTVAGGEVGAGGVTAVFGAGGLTTAGGGVAGVMGFDVGPGVTPLLVVAVMVAELVPSGESSDEASSPELHPSNMLAAIIDASVATPPIKRDCTIVPAPFKRGHDQRYAKENQPTQLS